MKKKAILACLTLAAIGLFSGIANSSPGYLSQFNTNYGTSGTALNSCNVCHTSPPTLNPYGNDWLNSGYSFAAIEPLDSDGDGFSNLAEIQARTFPGNAASKPAAGDTTPPTVSSFGIPATSTALMVSITAFTATDNVGVTGYMVTESAAAPAAAAAGWSAAAPASYTCATAGAKTLYAWAKDAAGNVSTSLSASVTITLPTVDTTPPTVTAFSIPATSTALTVSITAFAATDNVGVTGFMVTESAAAPAAGAAGWGAGAPASYTFASSGAKTLYAWAKDAAGNVSASRSASVTVTTTTVDTTPPGVTAFAIPASSTSLTVSITSFTATDNVGVTGYMVTEAATAPAAAAAGWSATPPASYVFATTGAKILYAWAKDAAGNVSASVSASVTVTPTDTTRPTVTGFTIPSTATRLVISITSVTATDNVGVTGYMVTESATAPTAAAAGWAAAPPSTYTFASAGAKTLYAWAKDASGNVSTSRSASVTIALSGPAIIPTSLGVFRGGEWYWDSNGNGIWDGCGVDGCLQSFGMPGDIPVSGDWTGTGTRKIGVFRQGHWYLDMNGNGTWDGCGVDACIESFGSPGDIPVVGDWTGNGIHKIGVFRQGHWYLDKNGNGTWDGCSVDSCFESYGLPGDDPVVGDWTGNGTHKIGVFRQGQWYLDKNGNGAWDGCSVDSCFESFGLPDDIPVVGDWTGNGIHRIGVFRQGHWYYDTNGNGIWNDCGTDTCAQNFGMPGDVPFAK